MIIQTQNIQKFIKITQTSSKSNFSHYTDKINTTWMLIKNSQRVAVEGFDARLKEIPEKK
jgi:hypothetical protein